MKKIILFVLLFYSSNVFGQFYESIENEAANVFLKSENKSEAKIELESLKLVLFAEVDRDELEKTYKVSLESFDSLRNHFAQFESEVKNISVDSALFLFNQWYLQLSNTFYDYQNEKFFSSNKTKILFFSASMSCQCTLEMCKNQSIDILNFVKENTDEYDYWIVDSYEHNELQLKYETYFAPSVIVFDNHNKVLFKIEYEEKMLEQLASLLNGKSKKG